MKILKINLENPDEEILKEARRILKRGGAVVYPTDTLYGLGVNALSDISLRKLFQIKKRPFNKPIPIMVRDLEMAKKLAFIDRKTERVLNLVWPGAVTVVLEKKSIVPDILTASQSTVGLRIPDCLISQLLIKNLDFPITCTSANLSGQEPLFCGQEIFEVFQKQSVKPDLILEAGCLSKKSPSTILDLTGPQPRILRVGPVSKGELLKIIGS